MSRIRKSLDALWHRASHCNNGTLKVASPKISLTACLLLNRDVRGQGDKGGRVSRGTPQAWYEGLDYLTRELQDGNQEDSHRGGRFNLKSSEGQDKFRAWKLKEGRETGKSAPRQRAQGRSKRTSSKAESGREWSLTGWQRKRIWGGCVHGKVLLHRQMGTVLVLLHLLTARTTQWKGKGIPCYF